MSDIYGTIAGADTYHEARGNVVWAGYDEDDKAAALLRGSEYIDATYGRMFAGLKVNGRAQVRQWPRSGAFDIDGNTIPVDEIPLEAQNASYEAALREAATPGSLSPDFVAADGIKQASVDGAVSVTFHGSGTIEDAQPVIQIIDAIIAPLLAGDGAGFATGLAGSRVRV